VHQDPRFEHLVNFLLHRHFAAEETGSAHAGIGAMLPDLWRMADRKVRARHERFPADDHVLDGVLRGVTHHLDADRWFHRVQVFVDGERALAARLAAAPFSAKRLPLFAHVIWEMCLDGALIASVGLDATVSLLRSGFDETLEAAARAATLHHFGGAARPDDERRRFEVRMTRLRDELARGPWIDGYQDGPGLAIRTAGVRSRLGFAPFDSDDHARLGDVLDEAAALARPALAALMVARAQENNVAGAGAEA
jgi:hypothetical protein